jgi:hypothetical protein
LFGRTAGLSGGFQAGLVALVEEDHAVQFVALKNGPSTAHAGVHLVHALPGPLGGGLPAPFGDAVVDVAAGQAEPELAQMVGPELDESWAFFLYLARFCTVVSLGP